jgi:hypothetical protein
MKTSITIVLLCLNFFTILAQKSDYAQVEKTVSYYLDGGTNNDFETIKKAFHETATMKYIRNGEYREVNALEFFKKAVKHGPKQNRKTRISYINVSGNVASAKLQIDYETFSFIDYMNLIKINGEWKVVNKIFYKK